MEPGSRWNMWISCFSRFSGCIARRSSRGRESGWPLCGGSFNGMAVAFGPRARRGKARNFGSQWALETTDEECRRSREVEPLITDGRKKSTIVFEGEVILERADILNMLGKVSGFEFLVRC